MALLVALTSCTGSPKTTGGPATGIPSTTGTGTTTPGAAQPGTPAAHRPDHVLVVIFENKSFAQINGSAKAPYLNSLMTDSAVFTDSHALTHPSQPNYIALFSGSTQGVTDDHCPVQFRGRPNLGRQLLDAGLTFAGYSEGLPAPGFTGCTAGRYAAKHNPWVDFDNVPAALNQPANGLPADYTRLPTVSFLIPDLCNDMHDCPIGTGDAWAREHLDPYVTWARAHNSLLVVTFDENDNAPQNQILTLISGAGIAPGRYSKPITHYSVLATVEHWYGLTPLGGAAQARVIDEIWAR